MAIQVKHLSRFIIIVGLVSSSLAGQTRNGKVISAENALEIFDVVISDTLQVVVGNTDKNGLFSVNAPGTYVFSKKGYFSKTIPIVDPGFVVVEMNEIPLNLNEVLIKTNHFQSELKKISASISLIPVQVIQSNSGMNIAPVLNSTPGVYMHNGTLSTNRITIRGIGSRTLFGTSKIRAYYQDIPLTNGSGETTVEDIELAGLSRMEILKGPSSSLYGAALGGTIQMISNTGLFDTYALQSSFTLGSFGLQKFLVNANLGNKTNSASLLYSNTHSDGYRDNNELNRQNFSLSSNHYLNETNNLVVIANLIDLKAYIPSSLDQENYINNPTDAAFTWARSKGFEDYTKFLFGVSWQHDYQSGLKQISSLFGSLLNSYEARPFNILDQNTNGLGLRTRLIKTNEVFKRDLQWTVGMEFFNDINAFKTFENLFEDYPPDTGSVQGGLLGSLKEKRYYVNLFIEASYQLSKNAALDLGLNFNKTSYRLEDRFDDDAKDFSGDYSFEGIVSPKIGLTYQLGQNRMLFGMISHGFSPPTLEETLLPDGLVNTDIQPETGWNYEIGSRGSFIKNIFNYELSLYYMDISNLLVARRTGDDQFIGVNAGQTVHKGIEIGLNYFIVNKPNIQIQHNNAFSFNDFTFQDFKDLDNDYSGNDLTGVPDKTFNSQLFLTSETGVYANINYQYIGEIPIRDDNSVYADSYQLVNIKMGYKKSIGSHLQIEGFLGINNIFNEKYASMLQINAGSFGNNAPRYYYPGEPSNYYAGLNLNYVF